jgi:tetratricopeptide (TPR) repeat protein
LRTKAARALAAEVATPAVSAALRNRLDDPIRSVRIAAAWALRATLDLSHPASRELAAFLAQNADQPAGQVQQGAFFAARQEWPQALAHYRQAVEWDTHSAALRGELALAYAQLNQNAQALDELRAAVRLEPHDAEYRYQLALAWNEAGDLDAALAELEQAVHLNPRHARAWYNLGLARAAKKDPRNALEALTQAETLAPTDPAMPYARATVLAQLGRPAEARAAAGRALEIDPHFAPAREWLQLPNP